MVSRFADKVVIITRAGTGIGAATARRFHAEGASVVLSGRREVKLTEVAQGMGSDRCLVQMADAAVVKDAERLVEETVSRFGTIDILVNNARMVAAGNLLTQPFEQWRDLFAVSLDGVLNTTNAVLPIMVGAMRGSVVNVSSVAGPGDGGRLNVYDPAKGAIRDLTRDLAMAFAPKGIRINSVWPGATFTEMNAPNHERNHEFRGQLERIPMGRLAQLEEVASAVAFLASEDASYITGVTLPVDGGVSASKGLA